MNRNDPLGLFPSQQPPAQVSGGTSNLLVGILLGIALSIAFQRGQQEFGGDRDEQHQEQKDDKQDQGDKKDVAPKVTGGYLFFIHERNLPTANQADILDAAEAYCEANPSFGFRSVDDEAAAQSDATKPLMDYAAGKGISPPFMAVKDQDGKFTNAIAWPSTPEEMKAAIK